MVIAIIKRRGMRENWWTGKLWSEKASGHSVRWCPECGHCSGAWVGLGGPDRGSVRTKRKELSWGGVATWTLTLPRTWGGEDWCRVPRPLVSVSSLWPCRVIWVSEGQSWGGCLGVTVGASGAAYLWQSGLEEGSCGLCGVLFQGFPSSLSVA